MITEDKCPYCNKKIKVHIVNYKTSRIEKAGNYTYKPERKKIILDLFEKNKFLSRNMIKELLGYGWHTINNDFKELEKIGEIKLELKTGKVEYYTKL